MRFKWQAIAAGAFLVITVLVVARIWFWEDPNPFGYQFHPSGVGLFLLFALCLPLVIAFAFTLAGFSRTAGYVALSRQVIRRRP